MEANSVATGVGFSVRPRGVLVTGTDTGVGKTWTSAAWIRCGVKRGLLVGAMKPVATGGIRNELGKWQHEDVIRLRQVINVEESDVEINPYCFAPPISPDIAARQVGQQIHLDAVRGYVRQLELRTDLVVVEGVGGWRTPLTERETVADLARILGYPVILVIGLRLGCINQGRLSAEAIGRDGVPCLGWVGNQVDPGLEVPEEVMATLGRSLPFPCLGILPYLPRSDCDRLACALDQGFESGSGG